MKVLLLSDVPPCENLTGGLVLSAMVRFLPRDSIACFVVANPNLEIRMTPEFGNMPVAFHAKPNENWSWLPQRRGIRKLSSVVSLAGERLTARFVVRPLVEKAIAFGREQQVDRVWAVLQGQTTIRMAEAVADGLGVPLHTHVWDPFSWWAAANRLDGKTTRHIQGVFDDAIRASACVATASEPMAELYRERFGVRATPVISSHSTAIARRPAVTQDKTRPLLIGMAGQFYAASEWLQLVRALNAANWQVAGRPVRILVLGPQRPPGVPNHPVSFLGWKSQPDAARILSNCDILYCPYPFDPAMKEVSQYSFPSKLVLYLAAGRPIVFHGPSYAAPARYIEARNCGVVADRLVATAIYNEIERLASDPALSATIARKAQMAFAEDFTLEAMARAFNTFIGARTEIGADELMHDHRASDGRHFMPPQLSAQQKQRSVAWIGLRLARSMLNQSRKLRELLKRSVRVLALKIPRLRSLYHEIHSLYAEKERLNSELLRLQNENRELRRAGPGRARDLAEQSAPAIEEPEIQAVLERLATIAADDHFAYIAREEETGAFRSVMAHPDTNSRWIAMRVSQMPTISAEAEWIDVRDTVSDEAMDKVLRRVLEENVERLVVRADDKALAAVAIAVAEVVSIRTTVLIESPGCQIPEWLSSRPNAEFIEANIFGDSQILPPANAGRTARSS